MSLHIGATLHTADASGFSADSKVIGQHANSILLDAAADNP